MKRSDSTDECLKISGVGEVYEEVQEGYKRAEGEAHFLDAAGFQTTEISVWKKSLMMLFSNPPGSYVDSKRHVKLDIPMACSCMALFVLGLVYLRLNQIEIFYMLCALTVTSTLADAVFHHYTAFDILDRYWATLCGVAMFLHAFRWVQDPPSRMWFIAFPVQFLVFSCPLPFLVLSRRCPIGSELWRQRHMRWHYAIVAGCTTTAVLSHFVFSRPAATHDLAYRLSAAF